MSVESGAFQEENKRKEAKSKEDQLKEEKRVIDFQKRKEAIRLKIETSEGLLELKQMLESGNLNLDNFNMVENNILKDRLGIDELNKLEGILEKIEKLSKDDIVLKYIPESLIITKEEFINSISDPNKKEDLIKKVDNILTILSQHLIGFRGNGLGFLFEAPIDKGLISIQEDMIDIKRSI